MPRPSTTQTPQTLVRETSPRVRAERAESGRRLLRLCACLVMCAGLVAAAAGCSPATRCVERRLESKESPGRRYTAATFLRVCGVRPNITHVNLHGGMGEPPPDLTGLITSGEVFSVEGACKVSLVWKDAKNLSVEYSECGSQKVLRRETSWQDVQVTFAAK